jgi:mannose-6-phosphate isomerase-like protein (cupin superfamily)
VAVVAVPIIKRVQDVPQHEWDSTTRGTVRWWELVGGDTMPTKEMVVGIAEVPVGAGRPARGHTHEPAEVYYIISGTGEVVVDGETYALRVGDAVWIPPNAEHAAYNVGFCICLPKTSSAKSRIAFRVKRNNCAIFLIERFAMLI